jgi:hypothetical protein
MIIILIKHVKNILRVRDVLDKLITDQFLIFELRIEVIFSGILQQICVENFETERIPMYYRLGI